MPGAETGQQWKIAVSCACLIRMRSKQWNKCFQGLRSKDRTKLEPNNGNTRFLLFPTRDVNCWQLAKSRKT